MEGNNEKCSLGFRKPHPTSNALEKTIREADMTILFSAISSKESPEFISEAGDKIAGMRDLVVGKKIMCSEPGQNGYELSEEEKTSGYTIKDGIVYNMHGVPVCIGCQFYKK